MILRELKMAIQKEQILSLFDITQRFNLEAGVARDMLACLIRKGCIIQCKKTNACGTKCQQCSELVTELYQWKHQQ